MSWLRSLSTSLSHYNIISDLVLIALGVMIFVLFNERIKEYSSYQRVVADAEV